MKTKAMTLNNDVVISGEIISNFEFSHKIYGEGFYIAYLASSRYSAEKDVIPIMVSERMVDVQADWIGRFVRIGGQFRSHNKYENEKSRLLLSVFVREFEEGGGEEDFSFLDHRNEIFLDGYICKEPTYRTTPLGREIADVLLAVNRPYYKSDYIPCIFWGRNAVYASNLEVRTRMKIRGRIQSREYQKKIADGEYEPRIAYEVSVSKMDVVIETEE